MAETLGQQEHTPVTNKVRFIESVPKISQMILWGCNLLRISLQMRTIFPSHFWLSLVAKEHENSIIISFRGPTHETARL